MNEVLGIATELAALRAKYMRFAYVAPHDRVVPDLVKSPTPVVDQAPVIEAPTPQVQQAKTARVERVRIVQPNVRRRGSTNWRQPERKGDRKRIADVLAVVADVFGVSIAELLGPRRPRYLAYPRFAAMHILHKVVRLSLPTVGVTFKRDHTSCLHGVRKAALLRRNDPGFAGRSRLLARELRRLWRVH